MSQCYLSDSVTGTFASFASTIAATSNTTAIALVAWLAGALYVLLAVDAYEAAGVLTVSAMISSRPRSILSLAIMMRRTL